MKRQGFVGEKGMPTAKGARQALLAMRELLTWQGKLLEEALHDLDAPSPAPAGSAPPRRRRTT
ncbi:MAG: hypothetical protein NTV86_12550 [Planctomycetota bacterium]|nr:hypothetical protein [Planctomycetota bacterium]